VLPEAIAQFHHHYPDIRIKLTEHFGNESITDDLRKGRADIGFADKWMGDDFQSWDLMKDEYVVLLPATASLQGAKLTWEELSRYPLIMGPEGDCCDEQTLAHCMKLGVPLHVAYHMKSDSTMVSMVEWGLGITIIPRLAAEPIPETVQVRSLPDPLFRTIQIAILDDALHPPAVFAFLELLLARYKR
jgi:DNA-binding transcriptional LysR family regulator